LLQTMG